MRYYVGVIQYDSKIAAKYGRTPFNGFVFGTDSHVY